MRGGVAAGTAIAGMVAIGGGRETISEIRVQASENVGKRVTYQRIVDAARHCGLSIAADMYGLSTEQVCRVVVERPRRRRRGISAANIRTTKRVLRQVGTLQRDLAAIKAPARRR